MIIAAFGSELWAVWEEYVSPGKRDVFVDGSTDAGTTFGKYDLSKSSKDSFNPIINLDNSGIPLIVWQQSCPAAKLSSCHEHTIFMHNPHHWR